MIWLASTPYFYIDIDETLRDDFNVGAAADLDLAKAMRAEKDADRDDEEDFAEEEVIPPPSPPPPPPPFRPPVPEHEVDEDGYVVCPIEPWNWWPSVGRITS